MVRIPPRRRPAPRSRRAPVVLGLLALVLVTGACGGDGQEATSQAASPSPAPSAPGPGDDASASPGEAAPESSSPGRERPRGTAITTGDSAFGEMLFDRTGQAIYLFEKETRPRPACYGACAEAWPPVLTKGAPRAVGGADQALLGTTRRRDGTRQVTYAGHPLYFYAHEGKGEVLCHDVDQFGALWLVVTPGGRPAPH